jgi:N-acetylneuraminate synthase
MTTAVEIAGRRVGPGEPAYVIAELSANHNHDFEQAVKLLEAARQAGADAVKVQTYTPQTMTLDLDRETFRVRGTIWEGRGLFDLYEEAHMPWAWQPRLKEIADELGLTLFSTAYDESSVDFLERLEMPAFKIASFELVDLALIRRVARTGRPLILSTGMASGDEIAEAVETFRDAGGTELVLLKCTSAYPAPPDAMHLRALTTLRERFGVPVGLSDHTLGHTAATVAVTLGACVVEKHVTLSRSIPGPDQVFSLEPHELQELVTAVREAEAMLGSPELRTTGAEEESRRFRRSLFVVEDVRAGEPFTPRNVRAIRPADGLHPRHLEQVMGRRAARDLERGMPLEWAHIDGAPRERR